MYLKDIYPYTHLGIQPHIFSVKRIGRNFRFVSEILFIKMTILLKFETLYQNLGTIHQKNVFKKNKKKTLFSFSPLF